MAVAARGLLTRGAYEEVRRSFKWRVPERFNIAWAACGRHAAVRPTSPAVEYVREDRQGAEVTDILTFGRLKERSDRLANGLVHGLALRKGDRVGLLLPQRLETVEVHMASYKAGCVVLALAQVFGPDALWARLADSGARILVTDSDSLEKVLQIWDRLPSLEHVLLVEDGESRAPLPPRVSRFQAILDRGATSFDMADTSADDPALLIYTSGTTGPPKGALHSHRTLLGHLPGVEFPHSFLPQPGDKLYTPADWSWIGGMLDILLPGLFLGLPVVGHRQRKFDPERCLQLMAEHQVRNIFLPPTALRLLRTSMGDKAHPGLALRSVASGGETLGEGLLYWGREVLSCPINEFYGQTECNLVLANCADAFPVRPGSMGRAVPGCDVAVVDAEGRPLPVGELGEVAVRAPHPVMFLRYWNRPEATAQKYKNGWLLMGDVARMDEDGYFWYFGREDDVITSSGYRIGPSEIEACLERHPAVQAAAVVGVPCPVRTEAVKAFVVLRSGGALPQGSEALADELKQWVRQRLAAHCYPQHVEFLDSLPLTSTGKVIRRELRATASSNDDSSDDNNSNHGSSNHDDNNNSSNHDHKNNHSNNNNKQPSSNHNNNINNSNSSSSNT
ncbi:unnamed protein product [Polarella glacialis]|uniref:medium-chain acyl-CoA ligase n=1 Tax=Polarella glacialis TaxID=89957 RepID=A0A813FRC3_POLGL|nr:unnamed protein product [Polarella glacialis]